MIVITILKNENITTNKLQTLLHFNKDSLLVIRLCEYKNNNLKKQLQIIKEIWENLPNKTTIQFFS